MKLPGQQMQVEHVEELPKASKQAGFSAFSLIGPVFAALRQLSLVKPTAIQKKALPLILEGRDVVVASKTGSGKTLCYLLPMINMLKAHSSTVGIRALVLVPTKQLALQVSQVLRQYIKHTNLKYTLLLGGHSYDGQFQKLASNPDVIIATPGRLMQLLEQTDLSLARLQMLAIDQADLLFEMGFGQQTQRILQKTAKGKQVVLISATIPEQLSQFATTGMRNYVLVKTAVEMPQTLKLNFVITRNQEKLAALHFLLDRAVKSKSCLVFGSTRYVVDLVVAVLGQLGIQAGGIYGKMDNQDRKATLDGFKRRGGVLVVTDVASRGLDLPHVDCVIHYDYPASSKIFIHRSGRTARAGREGTVFCLISAGQAPYLSEISHLTERAVSHQSQQISNCKVISYGKLPNELCQTYLPPMLSLLSDNPEIVKLNEVMLRGRQRFMKTRVPANGPAVKEASKYDLQSVHPVLKQHYGNRGDQYQQFLRRIKNYEPKQSFLQLYKQKLANNNQVQVSNDPFLTAVQKIKKQKLQSRSRKQHRQAVTSKAKEQVEQEEDQVEEQEEDEEEYQQRAAIVSKKEKKTDFRGKDYISMVKPTRSEFEDDFKINESDFAGWAMEDMQDKKKKDPRRVWDKSKKNFVFKNDREDKLSSDKKGAKAYSQWKKKYQMGLQKAGEQQDQRARKGEFLFHQRRKFRHGFKQEKRGRSELKGRRQIVNEKLSKKIRKRGKR